MDFLWLLTEDREYCSYNLHTYSSCTHKELYEGTKEALFLLLHFLFSWD